MFNLNKKEKKKNTRKRSDVCVSLVGKRLDNYPCNHITNF